MFGLLCFGAGTIFGLAIAAIAYAIHIVREDGKFLSEINSNSREDTDVK